MAGHVGCPYRATRSPCDVRYRHSVWCAQTRDLGSLPPFYVIGTSGEDEEAAGGEGDGNTRFHEMAHGLYSTNG
eukprot:457619-Rhodomonas_salina.2